MTTDHNHCYCGRAIFRVGCGPWVPTTGQHACPRGFHEPVQPDPFKR
jgi:hypothetical protein